MNPSGDDGLEYYDYLNCKEKEGAKKGFWNPKHRMMGVYDKKCAYIDLFPIRNSDQKEFEKNNDTSNNMMGQLLGVTQDYIEALRPKLIIFANATTEYYWGIKRKKDYTKNFEDGFWMDYQFDKNVESPLNGKEDKGFWPYSKIIGINPSGVNKYRNSTNLVGTYFLKYRQHDAKCGVVKETRELTQEDIKTIVESIDPEWAKSLL